MKIIFVLASAVIALRAGAQLNLTPTVSERMQEGIPFPQLCFSDDGKKVTYEQPRGWSYSVQSQQKIAFYPPQKAEAQAEIEAGFPLVPPQFDEEGVKKLKATFLNLIPKDSEKVEIGAGQKNPVLINGQESYEVTATFVDHGRRYSMSILFVNLPREQIRCKVIADPKEFEQLHRLFIESLYGFQWAP